MVGFLLATALVWTQGQLEWNVLVPFITLDHNLDNIAITIFLWAWGKKYEGWFIEWNIVLHISRHAAVQRRCCNELDEEKKFTNSTCARLKRMQLRLSQTLRHWYIYLFYTLRISNTIASTENERVSYHIPSNFFLLFGTILVPGQVLCMMFEVTPAQDSSPVAASKSPGDS